jgi:2-polyprenyl-3-methyl-5-hydroxy-6-metoxy-1,4-benzoquinol methylase
MRWFRNALGTKAGCSSTGMSPQTAAEVFGYIDRALEECLAGRNAEPLLKFLRNYRRKHFYRFLETAEFTLGHNFPATSSAKVCEVGLGAGELSLLLRAARPCEIAGTDLRSDLTELLMSSGYYARHGIEFRFCDLDHDEVPFSSEDFDLVIFCETLEHLRLAPNKAFLKLRRVIKPGGLLVVTTPNFASLRNRLALLAGLNPTKWWPPPDDPYGTHIREYTMGEVKRFLSDAGFKVVKTRFGYPLVKTSAVSALIRLPYLGIVRLVPQFREILMLSALKVP